MTSDTEKKHYLLTSLFPQSLTDLLHLLGTHIVRIHNETLGVLIKQLL